MGEETAAGHDWEKVDGSLAPGLRGVPLELWTKSVCKRCGATRSIVASTASYDPPGEKVEGLGELEPACRDTIVDSP